jgi:DNA polymerase-3 subunit delta'
MRFSDVIGQEQVKEHLRQRVKTGELAHANLFLGPEGSGTWALALAFAQYACCPHRTDEDACGTCDVCNKFDTLQYADLHFTFPVYKKDGADGGLSAGFNEQWRSFILKRAYPTYEHWRDHLQSERKSLLISVAEGAEIAKKMVLKPYEGRYNIRVIWMPELMNHQTANKLLKLIEEPPKQALFLLVSESTEFILPTILSRTQLVKVPPVADQAIAQALIERHGADPAKAHDIANFVEGNYAHAIEIVTNAEGQSAFLEGFRNWMRACYSRDAAALVGFTAELGAKPREQQKQFLSYTLHFFRQCLVFNYGGDELARFTSAEADFAKRFAPFINERNVIKMNDLVNEAIADIIGNVSGKMVLLDLSLKLHSELRR